MPRMIDDSDLQEAYLTEYKKILPIFRMTEKSFKVIRILMIVIPVIGVLVTFAVWISGNSESIYHLFDIEDRSYTWYVPKISIACLITVVLSEALFIEWILLCREIDERVFARASRYVRDLRIYERQKTKLNKFEMLRQMNPRYYEPVNMENDYFSKETEI